MLKKFLSQLPIIGKFSEPVADQSTEGEGDNAATGTMGNLLNACLQNNCKKGKMLVGFGLTFFDLEFPGSTGSFQNSKSIPVKSGYWMATTAVPCFLTGICKELIPYHHLQLHLLIDHVNQWRANRMPKITSTIIIHEEHMKRLETDWSPKWLQAYDNNFFFKVSRSRAGTWLAWVWILGEAQEENLYLANIRFSKGDNCVSQKVNVLSYRLHGWDIVAAGDSSSLRITDTTMKELLGNSDTKIHVLEVSVEIEPNLTCPRSTVDETLGTDSCSGDSGCSIFDFEKDNAFENMEIGFENSVPVPCFFDLCNRWFPSYKALYRHLKVHPIVPSLEFTTWVVIEQTELGPDPEWNPEHIYTYKYSPKWYQAHGHNFFLMMIRNSPGVWFLWVSILDGQQVADRFQSTIQILKNERCIGGEFPVYSVRTSEEVVAKGQRCFVISDSKLKNFLEIGENYMTDVKIVVTVEPFEADANSISSNFFEPKNSGSEIFNSIGHSSGKTVPIENGEILAESDYD